jgi:hypothetical protein
MVLFIYFGLLWTRSAYCLLHKLCMCQFISPALASYSVFRDMQEHCISLTSEAYQDFVQVMGKCVMATS